MRVLCCLLKRADVAAVVALVAVVVALVAAYAVT